MNGTARKHVFISYARADGRESAHSLSRFLQTKGISTWQDIRDIDPYQDFSAEIEVAIESAFHVVVCLTPSIAERKESFVRREIIYAQGLGIPLTPLLFPGFPPERVPVLINHYSWITSTGFPTDSDADSACDDLLERIRVGLTYRSVTQTSDPFREYLHRLYKDITSYLHETVFHLVQTQNESLNDVTLASPSISKKMPLGIFQTALPIRTSLNTIESKPCRYQNIPEAFRAADGQLLLLGEPGAGKTTALIAFARDAIAARLEDPTEPLPLIGRLADWVRNGTPSIPAWLSSQFSLKEDLIKRVLSENGALLLFDGLDEIISIDGEQPPSDSDEAIAASNDICLRNYRVEFINEFHRCLNGNAAVVTCRAADYLTSEEKIALRRGVIIRPLDNSQVIEYLAQDANLLAAVRNDPELAEVVRTPLLLSFFVFAYQGQAEQTRKLHNLRSAPGELRDHIIGSYVTRRYEHEARRANWRPTASMADTYAVLGRVALENQDFEITRLKTLSYPGVPLEQAIMDLLGKGAKDFVEHAHRLHLLVRDEQKMVRFVHPLVRDHFALPVALKELQHINESKSDEKFSFSPNKSDEVFRIVALLARIGDVRAVEPLLQIALTTDGRIKPQYHFHLDKFCDPRIVLAYSRTLSSKEPYYIYYWVSEDAPDSLKKLCTSMGADKIARILIDAILTASGRERADYLIALGLTGSVLGIGTLIDNLGDQDPEVRACSAFSLGQLGDEQCIAALSGTLNDRAFENRPNFTYPWGLDGFQWDPRENPWEPVVHRSVGEIAAEALRKVRSRLSVR